MAQDSSLSCVQDRRLKLSLPDAAPHVVHHADLGVHVDRCPRGVLEVEDVHAVRRGLAAQLDGLLPADLVGRQREAAVHVRVPRHHRDQVQVGIVVERVREQLGDVRDHRYWSSR